MISDKTIYRFYIFALVMLIAAVSFGVLAACSYIFPGFWKEQLGFIKLRPMHVTSALFWILTGATGSVYAGIKHWDISSKFAFFPQLQLCCWIIAFSGIIFSYLHGQFGGREYWEYPWQWSLFILLAWLMMVMVYFSAALKVKSAPVYMWMWGTGISFFVLIFIENYLWLFPYFRENFIRDTTVQWKANGALVGCWNQLIYGSAFFLMEKISGDSQPAKSRLSFAMYFLGLFNLMFNWSHHIYTLPQAAYVRYIGYAVSMTEWVILLRILYNFSSSLSEAKKYYHRFSYRFLMAADGWVFLNLLMALLMSVPAVNLYTHGTHITVAHAMGTTIGINSMILLALIFEFTVSYNSAQKIPGWMNYVFYILQFSLLLFWIFLIIAGIKKAVWQRETGDKIHFVLMNELQPWFQWFSMSGFVLMCCFMLIAVWLLKVLLLKHKNKRNLSWKIKRRDVVKVLLLSPLPLQC